MSGKKLFHYLCGLVVATVLLAVCLPFFGVPQTHYLPPNMVYSKAAGVTGGKITDRHNVPSSDWFHIGDRWYYLDYTFTAPEVINKSILTPKPQPTNGESAEHLAKVEAYEEAHPKNIVYTGEVQVDHDTYHQFQLGNFVTVRYEKAYPQVNGLDKPPVGLGRGDGSNFWGGWLIWPAAAIIGGWLVMVLIEQFTGKEDF
ncbi:MAG: hypothetical protein ACLQVD_22905 [Capsulimonadaceae bacterium]